MKLNRHITAVFSLILSIFMLSTVIANDLIEPVVAIETPVPSEEGDESETFITEYSSEVVIPSHAFDFGSEVKLIPNPEVKLIPFEQQIAAFNNPDYQNSYFDKVFELHIAINAP